MGFCPFYDSTCLERTCKAYNNEYPPEEYTDYCGTAMFSKDYDDCPLYKAATGS